MCLLAARLPARLDTAGELVPLLEQDRARWDESLLREGQRLLDASATGPEVSEYHLEAAIAAVHARAPHPDNTAWDEIVALYDRLLVLRPSPVVALHRAIAFAQRHGPASGLAAIEAIEAIDGSERLGAYPFYFAARAELELRLGNSAAARKHFGAALAVARNSLERRHLERRLAATKA